MPELTDWPVEAMVLWKRISAYSFEHPEDHLDLTRRLAREQDWSLERARCAIDEYRRFCFLSRVAEEPLTPSQEVYKVGQLHLDTFDYVQEFCQQVLGIPLHHKATRVGLAENRRYCELYARTLGAYERWFGASPLDCRPKSREGCWNAAPIQRFDLHRPPILPCPHRRGWGALLAGIGLIIGAPGVEAIASSSPDNSVGLMTSFLQWALHLGSAIVFVASLLRSSDLRETGPGRVDGLDICQLGYLADGTSRAIDAGVTQLLTQGIVRLKRYVQQQGNVQIRCDPPQLELAAPGTQQPGPLAELETVIAEDGELEAVLANAAEWSERIRASLVTRNLALSGDRSSEIRYARELAIIAAGAFAAGLIFVPVAVVMTIIALWIQGDYEPIRTRAGDRALSDAWRRFKLTRLQYAESPLRHSELGLAVALGGTTYALHYSDFADYPGVNPPKPPESV